MEAQQATGKAHASLQFGTLQHVSNTLTRRLFLRRDEIAAYVQDCQEAFEYEDSRGGGITFGLGPNQCPAALLYHPTGYTAVVSEAL